MEREIFVISSFGKEKIPASGWSIWWRVLIRRKLRCWPADHPLADRKSTRLNSSHLGISYAVFCLKKKKRIIKSTMNNYKRARTLSHRHLHHLTDNGCVRHHLSVRSAMATTASNQHTSYKRHEYMT